MNSLIAKICEWSLFLIGFSVWDLFIVSDFVRTIDNVWGKFVIMCYLLNNDVFLSLSAELRYSFIHSPIFNELLPSVWNNNNKFHIFTRNILVSLLDRSHKCEAYLQERVWLRLLTETLFHNSEGINTYEKESRKYLNWSAKTIQSLSMIFIPSTRRSYRHIFTTDYSIRMKVGVICFK
jgi:hypothetical protein